MHGNQPHALRRKGGIIELIENLQQPLHIQTVIHHDQSVGPLVHRYATPLGKKRRKHFGHVSGENKFQRDNLHEHSIIRRQVFSLIERLRGFLGAAERGTIR